MSDNKTKKKKLMNYPVKKVRCKQCEKNQSSSEYTWVARGTANGDMQDNLVLNSRTCRKCSNANRKVVSNLKKLHPIPKNNKCECCGRTDRRLHLDHGHSTDAFRGWLCQECNVGFGKLGDTLDSAINLMAYMMKNKSFAEKDMILNQLKFKV